jgi:choline dehydrogenase-like flavoprotein
MRVDLEEAISGSEFASEVCIIGAGIAGLVLARRLATHGIAVHLLEGGGLTLEERSQSLYQAEMRGRFHQGATEGRFRSLGGASTRWGGQLLAYPDELFGRRPAVDNAEWPIKEKDIEQYYTEIFRIMGVNDLPFTDEVLKRFATRLPVQSEDIRFRLSKFAPFPRRNLANTIGRECLDSDKVTLFLHANAASVDIDRDATRVDSITVRNYRGGTYTFKAAEFVLCTGTIETSRLLLSSTGVRHAGVANDTDQVGRYFHDHLTTRALFLGPESKKVFSRYFSPYYAKSTLHSPKLEATPAAQARLELPEVMAHFFIHEMSDEFVLLRQTLVDLQRGKLTWKNFLRLPMLISGGTKMAYALKVKGRRPLSSQTLVSLNIETEQVPRADSRILPSDKLNAIGLRGTVVDWKVSRQDAEAQRCYAGLIDTYLRSCGMKDLDWQLRPEDDVESWLQAGNDILHPMGGARMGLRREESVVDQNLRVHGLSNLYIASCAVFPSGGSSNPTFTMMALSCRLADMLKNRRASP